MTSWFHLQLHFITVTAVKIFFKYVHYIQIRYANCGLWIPQNISRAADNVLIPCHLNFIDTPRTLTPSFARLLSVIVCSWSHRLVVIIIKVIVITQTALPYIIIIQSFIYNFMNSVLCKHMAS